MMKTALILLIIVVLALEASGNAFNGSKDPKHLGKVYHSLTKIQSRPHAAPSSDPWLQCWNCESLANAIVNFYLNSILDGFIVPTCHNACSVISSPFGATECLIICAYVGAVIEIDFFSVVPISYVYPCQLAGKCLIQDCTSKESCAKITSVTATPKHANNYEWVKIVGSWNMSQVVGAGLVRFVTHATSGSQSQLGPDDYYLNYYVPGPDSVAHHIDTARIEPGDYMTFFYVCQGSCGTPYPHTRTLAVGSVSWTCTAVPGSDSQSSMSTQKKQITIQSISSS